MLHTASKLLFLPGASGNIQFWQLVADLLIHPAQKTHIGWPSFGATPADPRVTGFGDLVAQSQSMGGIVAMLAALERPELRAASRLADRGPAQQLPQAWQAQPPVLRQTADRESQSADARQGRAPVSGDQMAVRLYQGAFPWAGEEHGPTGHAVRPVEPVGGAATFAGQHRRGAPVKRKNQAKTRVCGYITRFWPIG